MRFISNAEEPASGWSKGEMFKIPQRVLEQPAGALCTPGAPTIQCVQWLSVKHTGQQFYWTSLECLERVLEGLLRIPESDNCRPFQEDVLKETPLWLALKFNADFLFDSDWNTAIYTQQGKRVRKAPFLHSRCSRRLTVSFLPSCSLLNPDSRLGSTYAKIKDAVKTNCVKYEPGKNVLLLFSIYTQCKKK